MYPSNEPSNSTDDDLVQWILYAEGIEDMPVIDRHDRALMALDRMRNKFDLGNIDKIKNYSVIYDDNEREYITF